MVKLKVVHIMVPVGSAGPEFHVNFGSGRVGSLHLWVESRKLDPRATLHLQHIKLSDALNVLALALKKIKGLGFGLEGGSTEKGPWPQTSPSYFHRDCSMGVS